MQEKKLQPNDNEIDLRDLIRTLVKQKKIISGVTVFILFSSLMYAVFASPTYKTKVSFLPPTKGDIALLKIPTSTSDADADADAVTKIYTEFEKNLNSVKLRRQIFEEMNLLSVYATNASEKKNMDDIFNEFNTKMNVEKPTTKKNEPAIPILHLTLTGKDPQLIAAILNKTGELVSSNTKQEVISGVLEEVSFRKEQLNRELNELRLKAEKQKQDTIAQLREADRIEKNKIIDQINTLRASAKTKRLDYALALEEAAKIAESIGLAEKSSLLDSTQIE